MFISKLVRHSLFLFAGAFAYGDAVCNLSVQTQYIGSDPTTINSNQTGATSCQVQLDVPSAISSVSGAGSASAVGNSVTVGANIGGEVSLIHQPMLAGQTISGVVTVNDTWQVFVPGAGTGFVMFQFAGDSDSDPGSDSGVTTLFDSPTLSSYASWSCGGSGTFCSFDPTGLVPITLGQTYLLSVQGYADINTPSLSFTEAGTVFSDTVLFFGPDGVTPIDVSLVAPEPSSGLAVLAGLIVLCSLAARQRAKARP